MSQRISKPKNRPSVLIYTVFNLYASNLYSIDTNRLVHAQLVNINVTSPTEVRGRFGQLSIIDLFYCAHFGPTMRTYYLGFYYTLLQITFLVQKLRMSTFLALRENIYLDTFLFTIILTKTCPKL